MRNEIVKTDITVIGGGLAGVCAAVAAARLGQTMALVQNRPVLGGNSSSEVRVWVCRATGHGVNCYGRETGIMGEMFVENQFRNPEGNPYLWDLVVLETALAEKNTLGSTILFYTKDVGRPVKYIPPSFAKDITCRFRYDKSIGDLCSNWRSSRIRNSIMCSASFYAKRNLPQA